MPRDQVVDTVDLYALPNTHRKLSLRFLAWVILGEKIQMVSHDSIEDSRTALRLYRKYLEFVDAGVLEHVFDRIYTEGLQHNFRVPPAAGGDL